MDYQVPQFIEVEDKIFGPLTLKQFIYLAGGAGLVAILVLSLPFIIAVLFSIPVIAFAAALAFYRLNGKPFVAVLESGFSYYLSRRLYLWHKVEVAPEAPKQQASTATGPVLTPKSSLTRGRLHELAWSLDVKNTPPEAA